MSLAISFLIVINLIKYHDPSQVATCFQMWLSYSKMCIAVTPGYWLVLIFVFSCSDSAITVLQNIGQARN